MTPMPQIEVYYDGDCPICLWEVGLYGRMDKAGLIRWTNISELLSYQLPKGKTRAALLGKFHVREINDAEAAAITDPTWHVGVDAFARIWRALPGLRHMAFIFRLPLIRQASMLAYRVFLKWQSWHRKHRRGK